MVVCLGVLHAGEARAQDRVRPGLEIATTAPIDISARLSLETPSRLRLAVSAGIMPAPYVNMMNDIIMGFGGYGEAEAEVVREAFNRSLVLRVQAGYRPFRHLGFYFEGGYTRLGVSGTVSGRELVRLNTGVPYQPEYIEAHYEIATALHLLVLDLGWEQPVGESGFIRGAVGLAAAVGASTTIDADWTGVIAEQGRPYAKQSAEFLDDVYTSYVYTPTASVGLGFRF